MQLKEAYGYLDEGIRPDGNGLNRQVLAEIDYFKNYYELMPKVLYRMTGGLILEWKMTASG